MSYEYIIIAVLAVLVFVFGIRLVLGGRRPDRDDPFDTGQPIKPRVHGGTPLDRENARIEARSRNRKPLPAVDLRSVEPDPQTLFLILQFLQKGQKLNAIKLHREATRVGLRESKDYVEALARSKGL